MEVEEIIAEGKRAEQLMGDPVLAKALQTIVEKRIAAWIATGELDTGVREKHYAMVKAIEELRTELNTMKNNGNFEQAQLERKRKNAR